MLTTTPRRTTSGSFPARLAPTPCSSRDGGWPEEPPGAGQGPARTPRPLLPRSGRRRRRRRRCRTRSQPRRNPWRAARPPERKVCASCHGPQGHGTAIGQDPGQKPADSALFVPAQTDGVLFKLTEWKKPMPSCKKDQAEQRWDVVNYLRKLTAPAKADSSQRARRRTLPPRAARPNRTRAASSRFRSGLRTRACGRRVRGMDVYKQPAERISCRTYPPRTQGRRLHVTGLRTVVSAPGLEPPGG